MKNRVLSLLTALTLTSAACWPVVGQTLADVQGQWSLKRNTDRWGEVTQQLEIKDQTFNYRIQSKSGDTLLRARGKVKVERLGTFKTIHFTDIEGGYGDESLQSVNDDRIAIYVTGWNTLTIALNFDQYRDDDEARAETYTKAKNP